MALWHSLLLATTRNTIRNIHSLMFVDKERQEERQKRKTEGKVMAGEKLHFGEAKVREGSQALPARPSHRGGMKVKNSELSEAGILCL